MLNDYNKSLHKLVPYFSESLAIGLDIRSSFMPRVHEQQKLQIVCSLFITKSFFDDIIPLMNEIPQYENMRLARSLVARRFWVRFQL